MLVLLTASDRACPHYLHAAINPRICYTTAGVKVLVFDCGMHGCGARDVVDLADPNQGRAYVNKAGDATNATGLHGGGPRQRSSELPAESESHRVIPRNLKGG